MMLNDNEVHVIALFATVENLSDCLDIHGTIAHKFIPGGAEFDPIMNVTTIGSTTFITWVSSHKCQGAEIA